MAVGPATLDEARRTVLSESQKRSLQIAKSMVKIRKHIFSLSARSSRSPHQTTVNHPTFTSALGLAASCLPEMDEVIRSWGYPVNPDEADRFLLQTLRAKRDSSRRFVQAAGTLARVLGGRLLTASSTILPILDSFREITSAPQEGPHTSSREVFNYDFLKAILLWLEGGKEALLQVSV